MNNKLKQILEVIKKNFKYIFYCQTKTLKDLEDFLLRQKKNYSNNLNISTKLTKLNDAIRKNDYETIYRISNSLLHDI